ncbi:10310_t:CDS:2 [Dentiscutata erythropus]|uniref:10310_t:CDS:1 n=1 Tax=Dentiscutata erythropus TaxID=1348616 RepID=A0A9N8ZK99_9GLOM|nr:10310_t:CDS:2 [Dentiscutata erythropus]
MVSLFQVLALDSLELLCVVVSGSLESSYVAFSDSQNDILGTLDSLLNSLKMMLIIRTNNCKLLTIHIYNDAICKQKDERSTKNIQIINIEEYRLKSTTDYIKALSIITQIPSLYKYLDQNILPVVAYWPGQLYIRKAITLLQKELDFQKKIIQIIELLFQQILKILFQF